MLFRHDVFSIFNNKKTLHLKRLSIASAQAFLLVYSVSDPLSFVTIKHRFEEIKEQRADFQVCPSIFSSFPSIYVQSALHLHSFI